MEKNKSILKQLLEENGFEVIHRNYLSPSEKVLNSLGLTKTGWNKIIEGEQELTILQARLISNWLKIPFDRFNQLMEEQTESKF